MKKTELQEILLKELQSVFDKMAEEKQESLLEDDLDEGEYGKYYKYTDKDYVHNGVGYECCRSDVIQDEFKALEDAEEEILYEMSNLESSFFDELSQNKTFVENLVNFLKGNYDE